ncbi:MAG: TetR/AcrR family transcriptional regulator [Polyangiaceae bacterium]
MASRRAEAKERTRNDLIDAGLALFAEQGLDGPSLDAICERAGYTRGAFYVHFRDREDFLVAAMRRVGAPVLDALLAAPEGELSLETAAARFLAAFADGSYPLGPAGGIRPHQLLDACARSARVGELYVELVQEAIARVAAIVKADQARGALRGDVEPEPTAQLLLAIVIGVQSMLDLGLPLEPLTLAALCRNLLASTELRVQETP